MRENAAAEAMLDPAFNLVGPSSSLGGAGMGAQKEQGDQKAQEWGAGGEQGEFQHVYPFNCLNFSMSILRCRR